MVYKSNSEKDTQNIANSFAQKLRGGEVVALIGDLGAGKTTFVRYLAASLGFAGRVQSPTFVVHRIYELKNSAISKINHLDLYRFDDTSQLEVMDFAEFFEDKNALTLIEWPQIAENILPENAIKIHFKIFRRTKEKFHMKFKIVFDLTDRSKNKIVLKNDSEIIDFAENFSDAVTALQNLLGKNKLQLSDIDSFESKDGEGSFTGIKVGATLANVLSWALGKIFPDQIESFQLPPRS